MKKIKNRNNTCCDYWIIGLHPVQAALDNPKRKKSLLYSTREAISKLNTEKISIPIKFLTRLDIDKVLEKSYPHQGVALKVRPLQTHTLDNFLSYSSATKNIVIILDKLTDPQNIGAIIRSAEAFSVDAIICLDKATPKENTLIAKSSAGAIEKIKIIYVKNLVSALKKLKKYNFWSIALDNNSEKTLRHLSENLNLFNENIALVLGNEGKGIRTLVKKNCDTSAKINISKDINSLNVSVALAIALYEINRT